MRIKGIVIIALIAVLLITAGKAVYITQDRSSSFQPEFVGISHWINSEPLTLNELRGNVVLVEFWRYSCSTCIRMMPYMRSLYEEYSPQGLVIVGVHYPGSPIEKDKSRVNKAVEKHRLSYPIALDNDHETSKTFECRYHPAIYLFDKNGELRYNHKGEGAYEETEENIRRLLEEQY